MEPNANLQLVFNDSSDEDNGPYTAAFTVVPDGGPGPRAAAEGREPAYGGQPGGDLDNGAGRTQPRTRAWGDALLRGAGAVTRTLMGPAAATEREPYADETGGRAVVSYDRVGGGPPDDESDVTLSGNLFTYDPHGGAAELETTENGTYMEGDLGNGSMAETENIEIDLMRIVMDYLRSFDDFYLNILMASLKSGSFTIQGDVFSRAAGYPFLVRTFLDSGCVNTSDPLVQQTVQAEVDRALVGDPYKGEYVTDAEYLYCLCSLKTTRVTQDQMVLLRYSGFAFIKLLYDFPHLVQDNPKPPRWAHAFLNATNILSSVLTWADLFISTVFMGMCVWMAVLWLRSIPVRSYGYWTIICYVGGYVVAFVCTMRSEEKKITEYDNQHWRYPSNKLRLFPVFPMYQCFLVATSLRYELSDERDRYFIIRYDLRNGTSLQAILDASIFAIPQICTQWYLYHSSSVEVSTAMKVCFFILLISGLLLVIIAALCFLRSNLLSHSCDSFGFAFMSRETQGQSSVLYSDDTKVIRVMPTDVATRMCVFFAVLFLITVAIWLFIALLNLSFCAGKVKVFIAIYFGVTITSILLTNFLLIYVRFSRLLALLGVPAIVLQVAFFIFTKVYGAGGRCAFTKEYGPAYQIPVFVTFAAAVLAFLVWCLFALYELVRGERLYQSVIDKYMSV